MRKIIISILSFVFIVSIIGCSSDGTLPRIRIKNDRNDKANVQLQTTGGNTINFNDVAAGAISDYQSVAEGDVVVTAVIQNEQVSPTLTFFAEKDSRFTIVIQTGNTPSLRVDKL